MAKRKENEPASAEEIQVNLKPIAGIKPHIYVPVIYIIIILAVLFFIFLFPGLNKQGSLVSFSSRPSEASVYIDDQYAGSTPCTVFVDSGNRAIRIEKTYFSTEEWNTDIPGRLFFSLFSPKRISLNKELSCDDLTGFLQQNYEEFSSYALIEEFYPRYQMPPVLSPTIKAYYTTEQATAEQATADQATADQATTEQTGTEKTVSHSTIHDYLVHALQNVHNEVLLRDFLKAASISYSAGYALTPNSIITLIQEYIELRKIYTGLDFLIVSSLPGDLQKSVTASHWYDTIMKQRNDTLRSRPEYLGSILPAPFIDEGFSFYEIPKGIYIQGFDPSENFLEGQITSEIYTLSHPHWRNVSSFYILDREVTKKQYARFLSENPKWRRSNIDILVENNLADKDYLKNWDSIDDDDPVQYISYYAAKTFCNWFNGKVDLPPGYHVRLPLESEWEYAARIVWSKNEPIFHTPGTTGPKSVADLTAKGETVKQMRGNLWEWCENWFFPSSYFLNSSEEENNLEPVTAWKGAERTVRGGSWANREEEISPVVRGRQPPHWCTPFLGFRPIISQKRITSDVE